MSISRSRLLMVFLALALAVMLPMRWIDRQLLNDDACCHLLGRPVCSPVVCFEFAWTPPKADAMLRSWGGRLHYLTPGFGVGFLFLLVYPFVFFLGLQQIASHTRFRWLRAIATFFAPLTLAAGALDAIENIGLLRYLFGPHDAWLLQLSGICAGIKFGLLVTGGVIILCGLFTLRYRAGKS